MQRVTEVRYGLVDILSSFTTPMVRVGDAKQVLDSRPIFWASVAGKHFQRLFAVMDYPFNVIG